MPSVSPSRVLVSRCSTDTPSREQIRVPSVVQTRSESRITSPSKMDTASDSNSASAPPDFVTLGPVDELQGIARRILEDRAGMPAYCASLASRISALVKQVGEGAIESSSELKEPSIRWHHFFPVASEALNDNVAKYVAARSSNARKEVVEFMNSSGRKLPAVASLPNVGFAPGVIQLAAFTGPRFFQSIAEPSTLGPDTRSPIEGSVQEGSGNLEGEFDHCSQAMEDLFHIIEKESPMHLSLHRAIALAEQAKYCMADGLMPFLPEYFTPMINELQPDEAAWFLSASAHVLSDRPDQLNSFVGICGAVALAPHLQAPAAFATFAQAATHPHGQCTFSHLGQDADFLLDASLQPPLPAHMRAFLLAAATAAACISGVLQDQTAARAAQALDEVLSATCGHSCARSSYAVSLIVDLCTSPLASGSKFSRTLLQHTHRQLLRAHFTAMAPQQLRMQRIGIPVRFPTAVHSREMFAAQLQLPLGEGLNEMTTMPTQSGWFLKMQVHSEPSSMGTEESAVEAYSMFINNEHADPHNPMTASFVFGVLADSPSATQAAEAFAASSEPLCDAGIGKMAPELGLVHRSGCRLEFSGKGWGKFGFVTHNSLRRLQYTVEPGACVIVFACVQAATS